MYYIQSVKNHINNLVIEYFTTKNDNKKALSSTQYTQNSLIRTLLSYVRPNSHKDIINTIPYYKDKLYEI